MAYDKAAFGVEFRRRMEEFDRARGIQHGAAASLPPEAEPSPRDTYGIEKHARDEWERSAAIREEFTCLEAYTAFRKAEARGAVRIISRGA